ncbi:acyltransferase [Thalassobius aquimarinus]|uniref:Acyltransferase n=1 Tax=Thalassovita aquimarina TaxID=2785917 RepID=A0ABS5HLJ3_9RHOB|nr:acyltransferase [Thalassovita aquimarina]
MADGQDRNAAFRAFQTYRATTRFGSLDGLRCLSILAVLWHHSPLTPAYLDDLQLAGRGFAGVDFFFVLSGFLITTLLLREETVKGSFSLRGFYTRRILRIVPVYFLVVTLAAAYFIGWKGQGKWAELLPYYYLFLSNFLVGDIPLLDPTWSLAVEEQYYLIWPLILLILPRRWIVPALLLAIALNVAGGAGALARLGIEAFDIGILHIALPTATYAPILMGSLLAVIMHTPRGFAAVHAICGPRPAAVLWMLAVLLSLQFLPFDLNGWPNLVLHMAMMLTLASLVVREDNGLFAVLGWGPVRRIGQVSYGIYLYHLFALHFATVGLAALGVVNGWAIFVCYTAVSVLIADLSFRLFETRFLALGRTEKRPQKKPG